MLESLLNHRFRGTTNDVPLADHRAGEHRRRQSRDSVKLQIQETTAQRTSEWLHRRNLTKREMMKCPGSLTSQCKYKDARHKGCWSMGKVQHGTWVQWSVSSARMHIVEGRTTDRRMEATMTAGSCWKLRCEVSTGWRAFDEGHENILEEVRENEDELDSWYTRIGLMVHTGRK